MTKAIFIASVEPYTGKSLLALGLVNRFIGQDKEHRVILSPLSLSNYPVRKKFISKPFSTTLRCLSVMRTLTHSPGRKPCSRMESEGRGDMLNTIISKYKKLEESCDFTVIEGSDFLGEGVAFEFESNAAIAKNLGAPVLIVITGENKSTAQVVSSALSTLQDLKDGKCRY